MKDSNRLGIHIGFGLVVLIFGIMGVGVYQSTSPWANFIFWSSGLLGLPVLVGIFTLFNREMNRHRRAEAELQRTVNFLDSIIENIPYMIFVKEAEGLRFVRFNKAGEAFLGYSKKELTGRNDYDFFPKEQANFFTAKDRKVFEEKKVVDIPEEPVHTRHQGTRIVHTKKVPVYDESGKPLYLLGIAEDITDQR
jgi:PAS domain S-box-containing protein